MALISSRSRSNHTILVQAGWVSLTFKDWTPLPPLACCILQCIVLHYWLPGHSSIYTNVRTPLYTDLGYQDCALNSPMWRMGDEMDSLTFLSSLGHHQPHMEPACASLTGFSPDFLSLLALHMHLSLYLCSKTSQRFPWASESHWPWRHRAAMCRRRLLPPVV